MFYLIVCVRNVMLIDDAVITFENIVSSTFSGINY